jgi:hypothetical protein
MLRLSIYTHVTFFILLHSYGFHSQILKLYNEAGKGDVSNSLNFIDFFNSPIPLYLAQYFIVASMLVVIFISSQANFSLICSRLIKSHINNTKVAIVLWAIISNLALFIANAAWFKHSIHLTSWFYTWPAIHLNTYLCIIILVIPASILVFKTFRHKTTKVFTGISLIILIAFEAISYKDSNIQNSGTFDKPHVIFIGIDSLRDDLLKSHMPFLSSQLKNSVVFENTFTPLGRTFPAWNSILTGLYPVNHGARINLVNPKHLVSSSQYLGDILAKKGYKTIFATDETRFSNMGKHHGFDSVISPRMGASDFIIAAIADFPLSNLLSLLPISSWILPEIYANRAAAVTYRAEAFSEMLEREVPSANQPMFLSVHFCLAHWPYFFASNQFQPEPSYPQPYYPANLKAVDLQIERLIDDLDRKGYLKNSKIVFLSDHGEAWTQESASFVNEDQNSTDIKEYNAKVYGHGSSLLNGNNRVLMAFKGFDSGALIKNKSKMSSLADIKPTVLDELKISVVELNDGISRLIPSIKQQILMPIETGTVLTVTDQNELDIEALISKHLNRYQLNSNGLVSVKESKLKESLKLKEIGIHGGDYVLSKQNSQFFRLFNLHELTYKSFSTLNDLRDHQSLWAENWCKWYGKEDESCHNNKN